MSGFSFLGEGRFNGGTVQIGELATETGVSVRAIRYYERAGLLPATRRTNGYRDFGTAAASRVRVIRDLLDTGFTIEEIVSLAECLEGPTGCVDCCAKTKAVYRAKLEKVNAQMQTLATLRERIEHRMGGLGGC
jgi:DNA-binding transcriptional MerR regulator